MGNFVGDGRPRWQKLYMLQEEKKYQEEQRRREYELEQLKLTEECTFKPKLISKSSERTSRASVVVSNNVSGNPMMGNLSGSFVRNAAFTSPGQLSFPVEDCFDEVPIQNLEVHQRANLWRQNKDK